MFAALHCRIPRLRTHALKLLQTLEEEDDVLHSSAAYAVCQSIADSERFSAAALLGKQSLTKERRASVNASDSVVRYPWDIPESARLRVISIAFDQLSISSESKWNTSHAPSTTMQLKIAHAPFTGNRVEVEERTVPVLYTLSSITNRTVSLISRHIIQLARCPEASNAQLLQLLARPQPQRITPRKAAIAQRVLSAKEDLEILSGNIGTSSVSAASSSPATSIKAEYKAPIVPLIDGDGDMEPSVAPEMCGLLKTTSVIPT